MKRLFLVPLLGVVTLAASAPARAQSTGWLGGARPAYANDERQSYYDARTTAYDNGFREGVKEGEKDGRRNDPFRYEDEKTFQRADKGYHREFGSMERYRQSFRAGYAAGYSESYGRYGAQYGDRRRGPGRDAGPYYPNTRNYPGAPQQYPGDRRGGYSSAAFQNGVDDGFEKGAEDARKNRSLDPLRHEWYRSGDRHYESRFGSREQYKDVYRRGFQEGYDRGYREGRYR
jgi:flagellar biosynthesis/type III secretory pathway protein FliH